MNAYGHGKFGLILAAHARVQGMVAENQCRDALQQQAAYGEDAFNAEAALMEELARAVLADGWQADQ